MPRGRGLYHPSPGSDSSLMRHMSSSSSPPSLRTGSAPHSSRNHIKPTWDTDNATRRAEIPVSLSGAAVPSVTVTSSSSTDDNESKSRNASPEAQPPQQEVTNGKETATQAAAAVTRSKPLMAPRFSTSASVSNTRRDSSPPAQSSVAQSGGGSLADARRSAQTAASQRTAKKDDVETHEEEIEEHLKQKRQEREQLQEQAQEKRRQQSASSSSSKGGCGGDAYSPSPQSAHQEIQALRVELERQKVEHEREIVELRSLMGARASSNVMARRAESDSPARSAAGGRGGGGPSLIEIRTTTDLAGGGAGPSDPRGDLEDGYLDASLSTVSVDTSNLYQQHQQQRRNNNNPSAMSNDISYAVSDATPIPAAASNTPRKHLSFSQSKNNVLLYEGEQSRADEFTEEADPFARLLRRIHGTASVLQQSNSAVGRSTSAMTTSSWIGRSTSNVVDNLREQERLRAAEREKLRGELEKIQRQGPPGSQQRFGHVYNTAYMINETMRDANSISDDDDDDYADAMPAVVKKSSSSKSRPLQKVAASAATTPADHGAAAGGGGTFQRGGSLSAADRDRLRDTVLRRSRERSVSSAAAPAKGDADQQEEDAAVVHARAHAAHQHRVVEIHKTAERFSEVQQEEKKTSSISNMSRGRMDETQELVDRARSALSVGGGGPDRVLGSAAPRAAAPAVGENPLRQSSTTTALSSNALEAHQLRNLILNMHAADVDEPQPRGGSPSSSQHRPYHHYQQQRFLPPAPIPAVPPALSPRAREDTSKSPRRAGMGMGVPSSRSSSMNNRTIEL